LSAVQAQTAASGGGTDSDAAAARAIAEQHIDIRRARPRVGGLFEVSPWPRALERAQKYFGAHPTRLGANHGTSAKAAEWFLDNYYFVRRAARQVAEELPRGFLRRLPELASGPDTGVSRAEALACAYVARGVGLDARGLARFVEAYQDTLPLTIAEVWALPSLLRAAALDQLVDSLGEIGVPVGVRKGARRHGISRSAGTNSEHGGVERSIRALRFLAEIDWRTFFEKASRVEAILARDPAQIYQRMDFDTCDSYRKVIEELAWSTEASETDVADLAVTLAGQSPGDSSRAHVGYYLIGEGRRDIEARLGYRPKGFERARRWVRTWPTFAYLASVFAFVAMPLGLGGIGLARAGTSAISLLLALGVLSVPISVLATTCVHWLFANALPPKTLPKLDFSKGIPADSRTLVVIPTLLGRREDVDPMVRQIEQHYLANVDPELQFALLTDPTDSTTESDHTELLDAVTECIDALNEKHGKDGSGPFHLLHRTPKWNSAEERFMGWERKRGKLHELNRLLRGDRNTSYALHVGDAAKLERVRYVITLDSDTLLPMGCAGRLVGLFSHPLNRAVFDDRTGRVISGYTIVQPRVETSPSSVRSTRFSQIFSGDVGYDIYTHACSDLYQDLFGAGIYVGKGIYEIDAFMRSVDGRVPENAIASHDLFEGVYGRAALATDVVLFEGFPSHYAVYARRLHRWVRGDWQLVRWLLPRVPAASGHWIANSFSVIDRWKIVDNLRRSLVAPSFFALFISAWTWLPGSSAVWTIGALAFLLAPSLPALFGDPRNRAASLQRWALAVTFLAHETVVIADAIVRVAVRTFITKKKLLEWTSAAYSAVGVGRGNPRAVLWTEMKWSPIAAILSLAVVVAVRPSALFAAMPILLLWIAAPEIACWASREVKTSSPPLPEESRRRLRRLARRTWMFFEAFVGPHDQWLPIDNYQEQPHQQTAHRTSPTNIGMLLLSTMSAYDLGYIGPSELSVRLQRTLESVLRLTHYRGHLLNWHDTRSMEPLLPRYVSTVDSGNFAGSLLAVKQGCADVAARPIVRGAQWDGLEDLLDLLVEPLADLPSGPLAAIQDTVSRMRTLVARGRGAPKENCDLTAYRTLLELRDSSVRALDAQLFALVETGIYRTEVERLRSLRMSIERLHQQLYGLVHECDTFLPWLALADDFASSGIPIPNEVSLDSLARAAAELEEAVDRQSDVRRKARTLSSSLEASMERARKAAKNARHAAESICAELSALAARAAEEVRGMDFRLLYDTDRKLFRIGYNVTADQIDANYYDLLASEARLASYLAIVKRDVPESHWYALGRPMIRGTGGPVLLSWGGTMFEYLMPQLLMRSREGTLLEQTGSHIVATQIAYGKKNGTPWGVSESAYARLDSHETYQYQSFGIPGLGFKRGLEDDLVVAPYASMLALSVRPHEVVENLTTLESMRMLGPYGMFESIDFDRSHATEGRPYEVVRSYMAHHQGMLLVSINNYLNDGVIVDRFHADSMVETGEILLNERPPLEAPPEWPEVETPLAAPSAVGAIPANGPDPWSPRPEGVPHGFVIGNGRLTSLLTGGGGGGLRWQGLALTRFEPDVSRESDGLWIYVRDQASGHVSRATSDRGRTTYALHKVAYHEREDGISIHVDITVTSADDVELRQVTLRNETSRARRLMITSVGEPCLLPLRDASVHPAFNNMFVETDWDDEYRALVVSRRERTGDEESAVMAHRFVGEAGRVKLAGYETDRAAFYGRGTDERLPGAVADGRTGKWGRVGSVLDPVMSLTVDVELKPNSIVTFAFVTCVASSRAAALALATKYGTMPTVKWAFRDAARGSRRQLQQAELEPSVLPAVQRLFSALLFADRTLRAPTPVLALGRPCKRRLWGRGISGDDPIVLLRVEDPSAPVLGELVAAQRYLRTLGVRLDLVLVDPKPSGYAPEGSTGLRAELSRWGGDDWINRHGGIFIVVADQLSEEERRNLESSARVVLNTKERTLAACVGTNSLGNPPDLPRLEPTRPPDPSPAPLALPELLFANEWGGFTRDGREYVVLVKPGQPTPAPWCNVLANSEFGTLVSESSFGCTWSLNSGENRLTPWRNDPVLDTPSEALYLRDEESASVWSPTPRPAGGDAATLVRHGPGYSTYVRESHGLEQEITVFVPPGASLKIIRLRLKNKRPQHRRLTATYYAEWVLGALREEQRAYVMSEVDQAHACLLVTCPWNEEFSNRVAFVASERSIHGFTANRTEFLGRRGDYGRPEALERWGLSGRLDAGVDPCAALQVHLELHPDEVIETHFILGQSSQRSEALDLIARFRGSGAVDTAWKDLGEFWETTLGAVRVKTPEPAMDFMLNRWLLYQTLSARFFGRTGFYQSSGAFGFRDQLQDVLAFLHGSPERTRAHLLEAASHQFEEGDVLHWWHPPEGRGVRTRCSDDMAWLPYVTAEYVAATGDTAILSERVPFLTGAPLRPDEQDRYAKFEASPQGETLFEHCRRALERASTAGKHGLPLIGSGDWNDGMNRVGSKGAGESVWLGWFLIATMTRFASLCEQMSDSTSSARWMSRAGVLRRAIAASAWDGQWYVRAFHDDGSTVGSASAYECRIDSIAQSWAALAGSGDEGRTRTALGSAEEMLVREADRLVLLLAPPFDSTRHDPGYIRAYPPGIRENGGQYTHAATWLGWAHAAIGDGNRATRIFRLLNPVLRTTTRGAAERYAIEPYVLAGDVDSVTPFTGRGGWSWYTGAAAWLWRLGVEAILGLRREGGHLSVNPCIPPTWKGFEAWISVDGIEVHVTVENLEGYSTGVATATLDGIPVEPRNVKVVRTESNGRAVRELHVRMGSPERRPEPRVVSPLVRDSVP
jgi:cyclic beta-1,2-glucan synthetase